MPVRELSYLLDKWEIIHDKKMARVPSTYCPI